MRFSLRSNPPFCMTVMPLILILLSLAGQALAGAPVLHWVQSDGHAMALWEKPVAEPKGQILLHHGRTWSSLPDFDLQVEGENLSLMDGFNAEGYSVWALDARGYGKTQRDGSGWLTPDRAAADLANVLTWIEQQREEKVHVWGWSYGSMIAQLTAQQTPELFASVTLFGYPLDPAKEIPLDNTAGSPPQKINTAEAAASDFIVPGSISERAVEAYVTASLLADPVRVDWNQLHQWNALDGAALAVPTLLLQAEFDPLAETESHARFFSRITNPNKQWVMLAGGDHAALLETPRARLISASVNFMEWIKK